jgi:hypothetical protein
MRMRLPPIPPEVRFLATLSAGLGGVAWLLLLLCWWVR